MRGSALSVRTVCNPVKPIKTQSGQTRVSATRLLMTRARPSENVGKE